MKLRILGLLAAVLATGAANATTLTIGDANELGFVNFGIPSGDSFRLDYVNFLIGMPLGSTATALGQGFTRSTNVFSPLPTAVLTGLVNGTGTSIAVGSGYEYLFAKYDGPNYGSEVWDIANLSGTITIPATGGQYGLSGWTLFDAKSGTSVPEPATLALFGLGLLGVALPRRRLAR